MSDGAKCGCNGRWAFVDLTSGRVEVRDSDPRAEKEFFGGRGLGAFLLAERVRELGHPVTDPLAPESRIVLGCAALVGSKIHTASRGSLTFFSPFTRSVVPPEAGLPPVYGLITHSSIGGSFATRLKAAGVDQIVIDGRAERPVRIEVVDGQVRILEAGPDLFEERHGRRVPLRSAALNARLAELLPGRKPASVYVGPAGWAQVPYACLTTDCDRNFGRGGGGAVFGSKNLVAVSVAGSAETRYHDRALFDESMKALDEAMRKKLADSSATVSFRPTTGTTWWLDRAFHGGYLGTDGGYLPWHNYDEGHFDPKAFEKVSTGALLEIAARYKVCTGCRSVLCSRLVKGDDGELYPRPEFETAALFINCGITDRSALVRLNHLCNEVGLDTMTTAALVAAAMDLDEKGVLASLGSSLPFGDAEAFAAAVEAVAYRSGPMGEVFARATDDIAAEILRRVGDSARDAVMWCLTTAYAGLGYAGIAPKAFPAMHTCYATSNRGRGDHTYAWTVQAEEAGLSGGAEIAAVVANSQWGKAIVDSMGLCDFFPQSTTTDTFLDLIYALTGLRYTAEEQEACGRRIVTLERLLNNLQGRTRAYDAFIPPKLTVPLSRGPKAGRRVDPDFHAEILDAYYRVQGWTEDGLVSDDTLASLGLTRP
ncbi:MAG TPA: aldehyde ferredoxin oxidoreductase C-terminal domain-containing protein [Thermoanaerobaculaceae bacterium]|nr:aldehyde ferredoxin oxidoreductase C-terminal domain-containing protein [Thermoanaerobaculaceae bacterium]HRS16461.1 aldehyde ferredoxin oxidoreductase C-terminal domain-containing protein [Thermoanaerobaculaceae bacterium]